MTDLRTWLKFLIGHRDAILRIARDRAAIWIGLLFVLSAGFAREYDGEDLLHEAWHALIPIAASVVLSFVLFVPFWLRIARPQRPPLAEAYRAFLTLFWMTAPMAWLYAIPYERLLDAPGSVRANMWTLAFVAVWRVALISRVISVLTDRSLGQVLLVVLMIANVAVQIAISFVPVPIIQVMGGVRLSDSDQLLASTSLLLRFFGFLGLLLLIPAGLFALFAAPSAWRAEPAPPPSDLARRPLLYFAVASVAVWVGILPITQPEQQRRRAVERELYAGRIASAIDIMSAHPRDAFPPHWDPPPRIGYPTEKPPLLDVMDVLVEGRGSDWVRAAYVDKLERAHLGHFAYFDSQDERWRRVNGLLDRLPEGADVRARNADTIKRIQDTLAYEAAATQPSATQPAVGGLLPTTHARGE